MKHKWIIVSLAIVFFLTAITFYANRILLPNVIRKIAVEQAQTFLKRKVEIESIHFNWIKGIVIKSIKIYQKDSSTDVFAQAEKISLGVIFIPGFKQHKLIFPSITIHSPSFHLIHQNDQWNFSDLMTVPAASSDKTPPVAVSVGSINIVSGKMRVDDLSSQGLWTELVDQVNVKVGLSYQGISYNGSLTLPQKQGSLSVDGYYWPLNQSLKASVVLKNIKPLDYLPFIPIKLPVTLMNGTLGAVDARISYDPQKIDIQGDCSINDLDVTYDKENIKTDINVSDAHIVVAKNLMVKGKYSFTNTDIETPSLSLTGAFKASIGEFLMNSLEDISVKASNLQASDLHLKSSEDQSFQGQLNVKIDDAQWHKDSAFLIGDLSLSQASVVLDEFRTFKGDIMLGDVKVNKDQASSTGVADINVNNFELRLPGDILKGNMAASRLTLSIDSQNNIKANGPLDLTQTQIITEKATAQGALHLKNIKVAFDQGQQTIEAQTQGTLQDTQVDLQGQGKLKTNAHFEANVFYPLKSPSDLKYNGSLAVADSSYDGLMVGPVSNINLTLDFKTDQADIQHLSLMVLDTALKASGHITNFQKPQLNFQVESQSFDLGKIKNVAPDLLKAYGLTVDGETSLQLKFDGPLADPLTGQIHAQAVLKDVNITSSTLKQSLKNISGSLNADGNSLSWDDFSLNLMDNTLTSHGHLTDFKNPRVTASLSWQGMEINAQINKNVNMVTVKDLSGHYMSADFGLNGTVDLSGTSPQLNLQSNAKFKLEDISRYVPSLKPSLDPLKLSGSMTIASSIKGPASNWKEWILNANAKSDLVTLAGFKFDNLNIDVNQENAKLNKFTINSNLYDGTLNIVTTADLNDSAIPFETGLHIEGVNLAKLKNDTGAKDEDLRGFIALTSMLNGTVKDILKVKGNAALNISQGYLMKKEFSSLFMIPELSNLIFTDATGNFTIADQKVSTQNFTLKSQGANLNGVGWVGFDHKLQFELHPEFDTETIAQSDSLRKGPSALIALAAGKYLTITIDGTLEKPVIHTIKKPTELIKKTGEILKDNVGQILQGFFQ